LSRRDTGIILSLPLPSQGNLHIVDYSNSPFARPDIRILIEGARILSELLTTAFTTAAALLSGDSTSQLVVS